MSWIRFGFLLSAISLLPAAPNKAADPPDLYIAPYLQNVTTTGITVMWETTGPVVGVVEFGRGGRFRRKRVEPQARKIHEVRLDGLKPATTYNYRVRYGKNVLPAASFTTAPPAGTPNWRFIVYGDSRSNPATHAKNVEQIMKLHPAIILNTGDLVAQGSSYEQWKPQYFDPMRGVSGKIPIYPCLGNHEQNAVHYYNYHSLPDEQGEVYFSFDYGNAHILSLNSNASDAPFELGEKQTQWIIEDLEKHKDAKWKIVYFHHPLFRSHPTRGITAQRWVWQPLFEKHGVDLVLNGHDHYYMRSYAVGSYAGRPKRGVFHLISGGGGANTYPILPKPHAAFRRSVHHVTVFDVMDDRIVGRAVDLDGNTFDAFVVDKRAVRSPEEFMAYEIYELERDLGEKIRELPVMRFGDLGGVIDTALEIPNPFQTPLAMTFRWSGTNGWHVEPQSRRMVLRPGEPIRLPIRARGPAGNPYPVPAATLTFETLDNEKAFRNDRVDFYPLKVWREQSVEAFRAQSEPEIDGQFGDAAWQAAAPIAAFVDVQGAAAPLRRTVVRVMHRDGVLYVEATIEAPEGLTVQGYEGRDNPRAVRDDHLSVFLGVGENSYAFTVNARGSLLDARNGDREWNSGVRAATSAHPDGWQVEMAIPLAELEWAGPPPEIRRWKINIVRRDQTAHRDSELSPTFGHSPLDHLVPMYQSDPAAVDRFADLVLR